MFWVVHVSCLPETLQLQFNLDRNLTERSWPCAPSNPGEQHRRAWSGRPAGWGTTAVEAQAGPQRGLCILHLFWIPPKSPRRK